MAKRLYEVGLSSPVLPKKSKRCFRYLFIILIPAFILFQSWNDMFDSIVDIVTVKVSSNSSLLDMSSLSKKNEKISHDVHDIHDDNWGNSVSLDKSFKYQAYATFLCDDRLLPSARVLVHSLSNSLTLRNIIVLFSPQVSSTAQSQLKQLGAKLIKIENLSCQAGKLSTWKLNQYQKVLFIDVKSIVTDNLDDLFQISTPAFPFMPNTDHFSTNMFLIKPSLTIFNEMLNNFDGTQITTASFIRNQFSNQDIFNLPQNSSSYVNAYASLLEPPRVYHFSRSLAPWNFFLPTHSKDDIMFFRSGPFATWKRKDYDIQRSLQIGVWSMDRRQINKNWKNKNRAMETCTFIASLHPGLYPVQDKVSLSIRLSSIDNSLGDKIQEYLSSGFIQHIYLIYKSDEILKQILLNIQVKYQNQITFLPSYHYISKNSALAVHRGLETQSTIIMDDALVSVNELLNLFNNWKKEPLKIHGLYPHIHHYDVKSKTVTESKATSLYTFVKSPMIANTDYLFTYTCVLPHEIHAYVDKHMECRDVAFNMMVSGLTRKSPISSKDENRLPYPNKVKSLNKCLNDLFHLWPIISTSSDTSLSLKGTPGKLLFDMSIFSDPLIPTN